MDFRIIWINPLTPLHSDVQIWMLRCSKYAWTWIWLCYSSQAGGLNPGPPAHTLASGLSLSSDFTRWTKHTVEWVQDKKRTLSAAECCEIGQHANRYLWSCFWKHRWNVECEHCPLMSEYSHCLISTQGSRSCQSKIRFLLSDKPAVLSLWWRIVCHCVMTELTWRSGDCCATWFELDVTLPQSIAIINLMAS